MRTMTKAQLKKALFQKGGWAMRQLTNQTLDVHIYSEACFTQGRSGEFFADASDLMLHYGQEPSSRIGIIFDIGIKIFDQIKRVTESDSIVGWIYRSIEKGSFASITIFND